MGLKVVETGPTRAAAHPVASPEDIFLAWLFWLPKNADLLEAATCEIRRIDSCPVDADGPRQLKAMFLALIANLRTGRAH